LNVVSVSFVGGGVLVVSRVEIVGILLVVSVVADKLSFGFGISIGFTLDNTGSVPEVVEIRGIGLESSGVRISSISSGVRTDNKVVQRISACWGLNTLNMVDGLNGDSVGLDWGLNLVDGNLFGHAQVVSEGFGFDIRVDNMVGVGHVFGIFS